MRGPFDDDEEVDDDLNDPTFDSSEDYNSEQTEVMKYSPEEMESPQFLQPCLLARMRGELELFLGALGITGEDSVAKVNRILDEHYPTFNHQTDALLELIEHELSSICLGGVTRISDIDNKGAIIETTESGDRRIKSLHILYKVRMSRLALRPKLDAELEGSK